VGRVLVTPLAGARGGAGPVGRGVPRRALSSGEREGDGDGAFDLDWLDEEDLDGEVPAGGDEEAADGSQRTGAAAAGDLATADWSDGEGEAASLSGEWSDSDALGLEVEPEEPPEDPEVAAILNAVPDLTMAEQRRAADLAVERSYTQERYPQDLVITTLPKNEGHTYFDSPTPEKLASVRDLSQRIWRIENQQFLNDNKMEQRDEAKELSGGQRLGPGVNYCVFCYHGEDLLEPTNTALLSQFVTEKGALLPKRFTACCSKHQRKLARTIKHARHANLMPYTGRLHPKLRFTSLRPPVVDAASEAEAAAAEEGKSDDPFVRDALDELRDMMQEGARR